MKNSTLWFAIVLLCLLAGTVQSSEDADAEVASGILDRLRESRPDLEYSDVDSTPVAGLYQVQVQGGPTLYVTEDARHFVAGELFQVESGGFVNLREEGRAGERTALMEELPREELIVFPARGERKSYVHVFTDVECGYCQRFHREIDQINALGIEVRYLAYPRAGVDSAAADKLATAWCAEDRQDALTRLKQGESLPTQNCDESPVASHYRLGGQVGISGTPAIINPEGQIIGGYLPADDLAQSLGIQ